MSLTFLAQTAGASGNSISVNIPAAGGILNQALTIQVVGNAITILVATDGAGAVTSIESDVTTAMAASVPALALVAATSSAPALNMLGSTNGGVQFLAGGSGSATGGYAGLDPGTFKIMLQDTNQVNVSNVPLLWSNLIHVPRTAPTLTSQSAANSIPENFWPTPPMLYRVNANIRFFIFVTSSTPLGSPSTWNFTFTGVRRYPCK